MTIECTEKRCVYHYYNSLDPLDEGPFCNQLKCRETHICSFERFSFQLSLEVAKMCSHQGPCDADVEQAMSMPEVRKELNQIKPSLLRAELAEYGAWEEEDLQDHELNLARILWIGAGNLVEELRESNQ